jgi:hypothetical protein
MEAAVISFLVEVDKFVQTPSRIFYFTAAFGWVQQIASGAPAVNC